MGILQPRPSISADQFTWNGNKGACEISDLGPKFAFRPVQEGTQDKGLTLHKPLPFSTGVDVVFKIIEVKYDASHEDIQFWLLKPLRTGVGMDLELTIFND